MKQFYSLPTATLQANPPLAHYHALACPGAPSFSVVVVDSWRDDAAQDAWEDLPGVNEHYPENMGVLVPQAVVTAFGPWGVVGTDTLRQAFRKIRVKWPAWRS